MSATRNTVLATLLAAAVFSPAHAAQDLFVKLGVTATGQADEGVFYGNGAVIPGADYKNNNVANLTLSGGYFFADQFAAEVSINSPATTHSTPAGTLTGLPNFGDDTFVTSDLTITYHPERGHTVSPYVGAGIRQLMTIKATNGPAITNFHVGAGAGLLLQGGVDYQIDDNFGAFIEARKGFYNTLASGLLGPQAIVAHAKVDPVSVSIGLSYGFGGSDYQQPEDTAPSGEWFIKAGATMLSLQDNLNLSVGGAPFPGAKLNSENHFTPSIQIGWNFYDHFAAVLTAGLPPTIDVSGGGTASSLGKLSQVNYGPSALTIQYRPIETGWFRPYVGAGGSYMIVFKSTDAGALLNTHMTNDLAPVVEAGADFMITDRYGFYAEVKKAWLETRTTGTLSGAPVIGDAPIHPLVTSIGAIFNL